MADREKVIKGLECCEWSGAGRYDGYEPIYENCEKCPYNNEEDCKDECLKKLIKGALELLKEQEPQSVIVKCEPSNGIYCGLLIAQNVGKELNEISIKTTVDIAERR